MRVRLYRNLSPQYRSQRAWSIMAYEGARKGRVIEVVDGAVLRDAHFVVSKAGRERVLAERRRNVHAFVDGELVERWPLGTLGNASARSLVRAARPSDMVDITYNPFKYRSFMRVDTGRPIGSSPLVAAGPSGVVAFSPTPALSPNGAIPIDPLDAWNGPLSPNPVREPFRSLLVPRDRRRLERAEREWRRLERAAAAAYEAGDFDRAADLDAQAEEHADRLEALASELTEDREEPEGDETYVQSLVGSLPDDPSAELMGGWQAPEPETYLSPSEISRLVALGKMRARRVSLAEGEDLEGEDATREETLTRIYADHLAPWRYGGTRDMTLEESLAPYAIPGVDVIAEARAAYEKKKALLERMRGLRLQKGTRPPSGKLRIGLPLPPRLPPPTPPPRRKTSRRPRAA